MSIFLKILAFIVIFGSVVLLHELGHFLVAKMNDIEVREFMIGFGPKLFKIQGKETEYSIRAIPLGGAVVMIGEEEFDDSPRSYSNKPIWRRLLVLFAGPFMNFVLAILLLVILYTANGIPTNKITEVFPDMPAAEAGIIEGDVVYAINDDQVTNWEELTGALAKSKDSTVNITIKRDNEIKNFTLKPKKNEDGRYLIGISSNVKSASHSFKVACYQTWDISVRTFKFIPQMFVKPELLDQVSGPVGIATIIGQQTEKGIWALVFLTALISISLGVFNLLPIVPLDGGKVFLLLIELIIRKPLNEKFEKIVSYAGVAFVLLLMIVATYKDIAKLIG